MSCSIPPTLVPFIEKKNEVVALGRNTSKLAELEKVGAKVLEFDLTEEQKLELLQTLWTIMQTMVDIGFGLDSTQMFLSKLTADFDTDSGNEVNINHTDNFNHASMEGGPNE